MRTVRNKSTNIQGVFCGSGWLAGNMSYSLPLMLSAFFVCSSLWAPDSKVQMSFNIWEAPDGAIRAVITADVLRRSVWFSTLKLLTLGLLSGVWIESGRMITFKWHPLRGFSFELVIFQVSLPRQQFSSWALQPSSLCLCFPGRGFSRPPLEWGRVRLAFPSSGRRAPFVCCLCMCSFNAPLNVFFFCLFVFQYCGVN